MLHTPRALLSQQVEPFRCSAATLLSHAAGDGTADQRLLERLEEKGAAEIAFWARALYRRLQTPALYRVRVERGCLVSAEEAEEIERLLGELDQQPLDDLQAELVADVSSPLHDAVKKARELHRATSDAPSAQAVRLAVGALKDVRRLMREHLDELLRVRPRGPWGELQQIGQLLNNGSSLTGVAALLRSLRQDDTAPVAPPAAPPCLLQVDALWTHRLQVEERRQQGCVRRVCAWCLSVLEEGRLAPLTEVAVLAADVNGQLHSRWQQWLLSWGRLDVGRLYHAVRLPHGAQVRGEILKEIRNAEKSLADVVAGDPILSIVQAMGQEATRLTAWVQQEPLRQAGRARLSHLGSALRSAEARARAADPLAVVGKTLDEPVWKWDAIPELLEELVLQGNQERDSEEAWARLCNDLPAELRERLRLASDVSPLDEGLDAVVQPLEWRLPEASRTLEEQFNLLQTRVSELNELGLTLDLPAAAAEWDDLPAEEHFPPPLYPATYRSLLLVTQQFRQAQALERLAKQRAPELREALRRRVRGELEPRQAPGIALRPSPVARAEAGQVRLALEAMLDAGKAGPLPAHVGRLGRLARVLAERRDLLGLEQTPPGAQLIAWATARRWVRRRDDAVLVDYLQELACAPCDAVGLLTRSGDLDALESALDRVRRAGQGRPRRWWARLYRDISEVLRGKIGAVPSCDPPWQVPEMGTGRDAASADGGPHAAAPPGPGTIYRPDLVQALAWLRRVTDAGARGETLPEVLRVALVQVALIAGPEGGV